MPILAFVAADIDGLLGEALRRAGERMEEHAKVTAVSKLRERAHLQPALADALQSVVEERHIEASICREHPCLLDDWPSRAGVDLALRRPRSAPIFFEAKWGDGRRVLGECIWDLAKMGLAVAKGAAERAFLLAGAPVSRWAHVQTEGAELFNAGDWGLAHVRGEPYLTVYWKPYAREGLPQPLNLPDAFITRPFEALSLDLARDRWELRAVEVTAGPGPLIPIPRLPH